jgi:hypothetical protein
VDIKESTHVTHIVVGRATLEVKKLSADRIQGLKTRFLELIASSKTKNADRETYKTYYAALANEIENRNLAKALADARYSQAKDTSIRIEAVCANCGKAFVKRHPSQAFCSNAKTAGKNNCKDAFWNAKRFG